jgi:hypothetical protein
MTEETTQTAGGGTSQTTPPLGTIPTPHTDDDGKPPAAPVLPDTSASIAPPAPPGQPPVGGGGIPTPEPGPKPGQPPAPGPRNAIEQIAYDLALAEAMKPLQGPITDVYSMAADAVAARQKLRDSYDTAVAPDGPLMVKWLAAKASFDRTAVDMDSDKRLDDWLAWALGDKGALKALLHERATLAAELATPMGPNEKRRAEAQEATKGWAAHYANWSAPVDKITAQIGQYAAKISPLNADINNEVNRNAALTSFWFEVAPKHLQLAPKLGADVAVAVDKVVAAVKGYDDLQAQLTVGAQRHDGSLYLIANGQDAEDQRKAVLDEWRAAATRQADAEATFKLAPDDAATRKQRWDKLKGDVWIAEAKKLPEPQMP